MSNGNVPDLILARLLRGLDKASRPTFALSSGVWNFLLFFSLIVALFYDGVQLKLLSGNWGLLQL